MKTSAPRSKAKPPQEFDSPWKETIRRFFEPMMALLFPKIHAKIDWSKGFTFLDKELAKAERRSRGKKLFVDNLVRACLLDGREVWILIHIEVQVQPETGFPQRMFDYNTHFSAKHAVPVISLAILADDSPTWRPASFERGLFGCETSFRFPICKLIDIEKTLSPNEKNVFAIVVRAHAAALRTRRSDTARLREAKALVGELRPYGFDLPLVHDLFTFIDWVCALPDAMNDELRDHLKKEMPIMQAYRSRHDRKLIAEGEKKGRKEGRQKGRLEGRQKGRQEGKAEVRDAILTSVKAAIESRFPASAARLQTKLEEATFEKLDQIGRMMMLTATLKAIEAALDQA